MTFAVFIVLRVLLVPEAYDLAAIETDFINNLVIIQAGFKLKLNIRVLPIDRCF